MIPRTMTNCKCKMGLSRAGQAGRRELCIARREPNLTPSVIFSQHSSYPNNKRGLSARNYRIYTPARAHTQKMHTCTRSYRITTRTHTKGANLIKVADKGF